LKDGELLVSRGTADALLDIWWVLMSKCDVSAF
jgi:hypothetical protein